MAAVAAAAGVSIETIYLSLDSKASLVRYLVETALSGADEPVPPTQRQGVAEIQAEPDPRRKVQLFARMARTTQARVAPIWQVVLEAAPADKGLRRLVTELMRRHVGSMGLVIRELSHGARLRSEISSETARDLIWAMNSPEFYRLLTAGRGWTGKRFEDALADAWQRILFD